MSKIFIFEKTSADKQQKNLRSLTQEETLLINGAGRPSYLDRNEQGSDSPWYRGGDAWYD